ncbi:SIR2 family protein [Myroides sp. C8-3]|uniref:P-loop NTPase n=1 Tax=Myroides sp. C8-3 TaxID=3400533 RepID=UPI003D2F907B
MTDYQKNQLLLDDILTKKACLFLGAGAVASSKLKNGKNSPVGNQLAKEIFNHFYPDTEYNYESLAQVSEFVQSMFGEHILFEFLQKYFTDIKPSLGLMNITKFNWANIYTTNIDRALETAYDKSNDKSQKLNVIVNPKDIQTENRTINVNYFKLHGCIDNPSTKIVFSLQDYAKYKDEHLKLFNQLSIDLIEKPMIFIGYSMLDSNFQSIWNELKEYCNSTFSTQRRYFIGPKISPILMQYLTSNGFICYDSTLDEFMTLLITLSKGQRTTLRDFFQDNFPINDLFKQIAISPESAYNIKQNFFFPKEEIARNLNKSNSFYKGNTPSWTDLKYGLDAQRDLLQDILTTFDSWYENPKHSFWIITGKAGDGKTTLLKRIAIEIAERIGDTIFYAKTKQFKNYTDLIDLYNEIDMPIVLCIDDVTDITGKINTLLTEIKSAKAKILIIGAARSSDWYLGNADFFTKPLEFTLQNLTDNEIYRILDKLELHNGLFKLQNVTKEERFKRFKEKANSQLLVAMKEATNAMSFNEIISNEYANIKDTKSREFYKNICLLSQFRLNIPQSLFMRVFELKIEDIRLMYDSLQDIIYFETDAETDVQIRARHSVIAEVISQYFFNDDLEKIEYITNIFKQFIPSNSLEANLILKIYHNDIMAKLFTESETTKKCYDNIIEILHDSSYPIQQKSLYLINTTNEFEEALELINKAIAINANNVLYHTKGMIYMKRALNEKDIEKSKFYLFEGKKILLIGARKYSANLYNYHTLINNLITWNTQNENKDQSVIIEIQDLINEAISKNPNDTLLNTEYGKFYNNLLNDVELSKKYFTKALEINKRNMGARYLLASIYLDNGEIEDALKICEEGLQFKKDEISLIRLKFNLLHKLPTKYTVDNILSEYDLYTNLFPKDSYIKLCYASYLYILGDKKTNAIFSELRYSDYTSSIDKYKVIYTINEIINNKDFVEEGYIISQTYTGFYIRTTRFDSKTFAFLNKTQIPLNISLKVGNKIKYSLYFNYSGAVVKFIDIL